MTALLYWWYVHAAQTPHAWACNEGGSLAEKIVTWEILGEQSDFLTSVEGGWEFLQIITRRQELERAQRNRK